ncbi:DUF4399 domain-containing protein [Pelagicoccus mobilis]|uniref:DUF4399 domain-containing protein n=1 Tax=Pelagicoccus mobilis TaxID=415221 RepID=A0A934VPM7_9BACT|nr:DUF4399 domain-containing protein [Pelagicoccus mobilis]MBK1875693.1 DUF4399 domain-containing protein [Pelagicoccus mobilis]
MTQLRRLTLLLLTVALSATAFAELKRSPSPEGAEVYIISPKDGETVGKTFTVLFGLKGMGVAPAGIDLPNTGHHHLLVDAESLPSESMPMPMTPSLKHFGKGQTEVTLTLEPGKHRLQLVLGDHLHIPHLPPVISEEITVTVK